MKTLMIILVCLQFVVLIITILYVKFKLSSLKNGCYSYFQSCKSFENQCSNVYENFCDLYHKQKIKFQDMEYRYRKTLKIEIQHYKNKCKKDKVRKLTFITKK